MIKKLTCLCALAVALLSVAWAGTDTFSVSATYGNSPHFSYWGGAYGAGTVFTATVSGYGPGNGVSFAQDNSSGAYVVFAGPGTGSPGSFYASQTSSPLSAYTGLTLGISATANGAGSYCTSTLTASW